MLIQPIVVRLSLFSNKTIESLTKDYFFVNGFITTGELSRQLIIFDKNLVDGSLHVGKVKRFGYISYCPHP